MNDEAIRSSADRVYLDASRRAASMKSDEGIAEAS
jgi:hypothetical protein